MNAFDHPFVFAGGFVSAALLFSGARAYLGHAPGLSAATARRMGVAFMIAGMGFAALTWALATGAFGPIEPARNF